MTEAGQDYGAQVEAMAFLAGQDRGARHVAATHISFVTLTTRRAYKLKRAVAFPYLDFSTPERRLAFCEREAALNRRLAPQLYLGARRITRAADGALEFDGVGALVDAVVEMRRFEEGDLLETRALAGRLDAATIETLATRLATFHAAAPPDANRGGAAAMRVVVANIVRSAEQSGLADTAQIEALRAALDGALAAQAERLDARRAAGKVRLCHGDLTLRNICLFEGAPTPFDCLEFSDDLATIDILYDLAFLLMDLVRVGRRDLASCALDRWLDAMSVQSLRECPLSSPPPLRGRGGGFGASQTGVETSDAAACVPSPAERGRDREGALTSYESDEAADLPLLPLFMAIRASIRAHVAASQDRRAEAATHLALAFDLLRPAPTRIVAIGGFSGTGKSTLAARLAPQIGAAPGARSLSSDRLRKRLFGVEATQRLPAEAYAPEISRQVYEEMFLQAERVAGAGWSVVVDAVFDRREDRAEVEAIAQRCGLPFTGLWLEAALETRVGRVERRTNDPSDATRAVVELQGQRDPGPMNWARIDAGQGGERVAAAAALMLEAAPPAAG